ncbi:B2 protein-like [Arachis stenosperma]|uniref:B2 protein-like n=1 Tax=Arachis stenosperma TaxID=217475 RepID=UPI0025ABCD21|nr:B2 protein-like [Arachis stenosperma]
MENNNQQSFWQFSDQLRLQTSSLANLSLNNSIWSNNYVTKSTTDQRRNLDVKGTEFNPSKSYDLNSDSNGSLFSMPHIQNPSFGGLNGGFNKGSYSDNTPSYVSLNNNSGLNLKGHKTGFVDFQAGKKGRNNTNTNTNGKKHGDNSNDVAKKLKTLPPSESLPRYETVGGYIFVCNNDTMAENLKRQLFGLPPRYRDSVRAITPGLPLFLYNYSTHQLHGIFEAASFGGNNIDPTAWEDKKCLGESRFPAQVQVVTRKICEPLEEDSFRPILHHYDGPKFRLELSVSEALSLLDIFADQNSFDDIFKAIPA